MGLVGRDGVVGGEVAAGELVHVDAGVGGEVDGGEVEAGEGFDLGGGGGRGWRLGGERGGSQQDERQRRRTQFDGEKGGLRRLASWTCEGTPSARMCAVGLLGVVLTKVTAEQSLV